MQYVWKSNKQTVLQSQTTEVCNHRKDGDLCSSDKMFLFRSWSPHSKDFPAVEKLTDTCFKISTMTHFCSHNLKFTSKLKCFISGLGRYSCPISLLAQCLTRLITGLQLGTLPRNRGRFLGRRFIWQNRCESLVTLIEAPVVGRSMFPTPALKSTAAD